MNPRRRALVVLSLGLACPLGVAAQDARYLPEARTQGKVEFITGGIGRQEQRAMRAAAKRFDLELLFTDAGGAFLVDVRVAIDDMEGNRLLETTAEGPIMLVKLPVGRYALSALSGERLLSREVAVTGKSTVKVVLQWPPGE
jgi:hypothetical protein